MFTTAVHRCHAALAASLRDPWRSAFSAALAAAASCTLKSPIISAASAARGARLGSSPAGPGIARDRKSFPRHPLVYRLGFGHWPGEGRNPGRLGRAFVTKDNRSRPYPSPKQIHIACPGLIPGPQPKERPRAKEPSAPRLASGHRNQGWTMPPPMPNGPGRTPGRFGSLFQRFGRAFGIRVPQPLNSPGIELPATEIEGTEAFNTPSAAGGRPSTPNFCRSCAPARPINSTRSVIRSALPVTLTVSTVSPVSVSCNRKSSRN